MDICQGNPSRKHLALPIRPIGAVLVPTDIACGGHRQRFIEQLGFPKLNLVRTSKTAANSPSAAANELVNCATTEVGRVDLRNF